MNQLSTAAQQDTNLNLWFLPHTTYIHSCGSEEVRKLNHKEEMNHCAERAGYQLDCKLHLLQSKQDCCILAVYSLIVPEHKGPDSVIHATTSPLLTTFSLAANQ